MSLQATATEWPSPFRAGLANYDALYRWLRERDQEAANRWRAAQIIAENALADGDGGKYEKWQERANRIEQRVRTGAPHDLS